MSMAQFEALETVEIIMGLIMVIFLFIIRWIEFKKF